MKIVKHNPFYAIKLFFCSHPKTQEHERSSLISTHSHNTRHFSTKGKLKCDALSSHNRRAAAPRWSSAAPQVGLLDLLRRPSLKWRNDPLKVIPADSALFTREKRRGGARRTARRRLHVHLNVPVGATRTRTGLKDLTFWEI